MLYNIKKKLNKHLYVLQVTLVADVLKIVCIVSKELIIFKLFQPTKPLYYDMEQTQDKLLYLVQHGQDISVEQVLAEMKHVDISCNLNIANSSGESLVGIAVNNNDINMLKVLLQHGTPHIIRNKVSGCLPIISVKFNQNKEMIVALDNPQKFLAQFTSNTANDSQLEQELSNVTPGIAAR